MAEVTQHHQFPLMFKEGYSLTDKCWYESDIFPIYFFKNRNFMQPTVKILSESKSIDDLYFRIKPKAELTKNKPYTTCALGLNLHSSTWINCMSEKSKSSNKRTRASLHVVFLKCLQAY